MKDYKPVNLKSSLSKLPTILQCCIHRFHVHICINIFKSFSSAFHMGKRLVRKPASRALLISCRVHSLSASEPTSGPNPGNSIACSFSLWGAPNSWRQITVLAFAELDPGLSLTCELAITFKGIW